MKVRLFLSISLLLLVFQIFSQAAEVSVKRAVGIMKVMYGTNEIIRKISVIN